jgi:hypothetical protein
MGGAELTSIAHISTGAEWNISHLWRIMINKAMLTIGVLLLSGTSARLNAGALYAVGNGSNTLFTINDSTGAVIRSVSVDSGGLFGLGAFGGVIYGSVLATPETPNGRLITINPFDGSTTVIGDSTVEPGQLAFDTTGQGYLFFSGAAIYGSEVRTFDKTTGSVGDAYACSPAGRGFLVGTDGMAWFGDTIGYLSRQSLTQGSGCSARSGSGGSGSGSSGTGDSGGGSAGSSGSASGSSGGNAGPTGYFYSMTLDQGIVLASFLNFSAAPTSLTSFSNPFSGAGQSAQPNANTISALPGELRTPLLAADPSVSFSPEPSSVPLMMAGLGMWAAGWYGLRRYQQRSR